MKTNEIKKEYKTKTIYHYTNWKAFEGIVGKKILRLSNISYSNDTSEILFGLEQLGLIELLQMCAILDNIEINDTNFISKVLNDYVSQNPLFAICFSDNRDDVAQWERYAENSLGVCVGFNDDKITKLLNFEQLSGQQILNTVEYREVRENIKEQLGRISNIVKEIKKHRRQEEINTLLKGLIYDILQASRYLKHPSFHMENETRIVLGKSEIDRLSNIKFKYETDKDRIREFVELDLEVLCRDKPFVFEDLIDEIIIGPKSIMDEGLVKRYLTSNGLDGLCNKVKKSTSTIR